MSRIVLACLLLPALGGCSSVPFGHEKVAAIVDPGGRSVAFIPFNGNRAKSITLADGITLAELAAIQLRQALPNLRVLGPSDMRDTLRLGLDESRWHEIGRDIGAELLVVGEFTFLETHHDKLLQSREGTVGFKFRVLDVSKFPPKPLANVNWRFGFPEDVGAKFETQYASMDTNTFRQHLLRYGAGHVAGTFYDHFVKKRAAVRLDVSTRKE
ncbi:MAG: hypothetical protein ABIF82_05900 [Planctomycetota bacterium]